MGIPKVCNMCAVQMHSGKNWKEVSALVPGRTASQCSNRWYKVLDPSIDRTNESKGKWTPDEDSKLKDAVQTHGVMNWKEVVALVPGRTRKQCCYRWCYALDPSIDRLTGHKGTWTLDEDSKLKDAVQTHGGNDWLAIAALVPGRKGSQCRYRWRNVLDPSIDRENGRTGTWTRDEDSKLKDAVQTHGDKDWKEVSALVPGRKASQCSNRWYKVLDPRASTGRMKARVNGR
jgi:myb proto-oncogene protein